MAQTVIGIFKNSTEAQNAKEHLLNNGFSYQNVDISVQPDTDNSNRTDRDQDFGDRVSNFFNNLFGDSEEAKSYTKAASRGTMVTVHAQSSSEAEVAADILDKYGAVDVDEYAAEYDSRTNQTGYTDNTSEVDRMGGMNSGRAGITDNTTGMSSDMTNRDMDSNMSNRGIDTDMTNRNMDTDMSNRNMDSDRSNRGIDTDMTNRNLDSDLSNRNMDTDMSNRNMDTNRTGDRDETRIPIIEENLNVGKDEVVTGGKRIHSRIVERPVEETIRLRQEHVNIERNPVDRPASDKDMSNFKEGTIEVTEHAEIPVVDKDSRVVEEVNVFKDVDEKQEVIRETLRNTEVETDDIKARNAMSDDDHSDDADHEHHTDDPRHQRPGII